MLMTAAEDLAKVALKKKKETQEQSSYHYNHQA